ncbi:hypothetical protein GCM10025787_41710 [Saccharopolyspora rosea]
MRNPDGHTAITDPSENLVLRDLTVQGLMVDLVRANLSQRRYELPIVLPASTPGPESVTYYGLHRNRNQCRRCPNLSTPHRHPIPRRCLHLLPKRPGTKPRRCRRDGGCIGGCGWDDRGLDLLPVRRRGSRAGLSRRSVAAETGVTTRFGAVGPATGGRPVTGEGCWSAIRPTLA